MGRAWSTRTAVVAGAACAAGLMTPTAQAGAATVPMSATARTALAEAATSTAQTASPYCSVSRGHARGRCALPVYGPGRSYHPRIDRKSFTAKVTNPWFPLVVGRTLIYTGIKDGKRALNVVVATRHVKRIDGVPTRVVEDRLYLNDVLEERTRDYYAQDRCGNVWYFGEDTATLDAKGKVTSTEGSFHAGVDGAQPGVFMQAHPQVGRWFRQEWYAGQAEDRFKVIDLKATIKVRYGTFTNALRTEERTALEPTVVDNKYYVRGVGEVSEAAVKGGPERLTLVEIIS
jgi:hypothetical protein